MKRITLVIVLVLFTGLLFASSAFTYSISQVGEKALEKDFGSLSLTFGFAPIKEKHFGLMETNILLGWDKFFQGVDFLISTPLYISSSEFFSYAFSNIVLWQPTVGFMVSYRDSGKQWKMGGVVSLLKFIDTQFSYEFFSPYMLFTRNGEIAYGIRIMKFSAFLEV